MKPKVQMALFTKEISSVGNDQIRFCVNSSTEMHPEEMANYFLAANNIEFVDLRFSQTTFINEFNTQEIETQILLLYRGKVTKDKSFILKTYDLGPNADGQPDPEVLRFWGAVLDDDGNPFGSEPELTGKIGKNIDFGKPVRFNNAGFFYSLKEVAANVKWFNDNYAEMHGGAIEVPTNLEPSDQLNEFVNQLFIWSDGYDAIKRGAYYTTETAKDAAAWYNKEFSNYTGSTATVTDHDKPGPELDKFVNNLFSIAAGVDKENNHPTTMRHICQWPTETKEGHETVDIIGRKCEIGGGCLKKCPYSFEYGHPGWNIMQKAALQREFPDEQF